MTTFERQPGITAIEMIFVNYAVPTLYINRGLTEHLYRNPNPIWVDTLIGLTYTENFYRRLFPDGWRITRKEKYLSQFPPRSTQRLTEIPFTISHWAQARKDI